MRPVTFAALVAVALLAAGCGQEEGSPGAASVASPKQTSSPESLGASHGPPDVLLVSEAGRQAGVVGSYCVDNPAAGFGECADGTRPAAERANVVRPGETVTIALDGALAVRASSCHSRDQSCIGEALVSPAGCGAVTVDRVFLERGEETRWRVDLEPGPYELQAFVYFEADDGRSGDVSVALGLVVDPDAERAVVPMPAAAAVCR